MKVLLWIENALANGYQQQLCYSKTTVLFWLLLYKILWQDRNYNLLTHIPHWLENIEKEIKEREGEQRIYPTYFRVKRATIWSK